MGGMQKERNEQLGQTHFVFTTLDIVFFFFIVIFFSALIVCNTMLVVIPASSG